MGAKELDPKTISKYLEFYQKFVNLYPEINQKNIDTFLKYNNSSPARAMMRNLLKSLLRWELPQEIKSEIGTLDIPAITGKKEKKIPKFMQKSDVDRLELGITDEKAKLMILAQFYAGLRISELLGLTYESLCKEEYDKNKEKPFQKINVSSDSAKFGKERISYLPTEIYVRVLIWLRENIARGEILNKTFDKKKSIWGIKQSRYRNLLDHWTEKILGESYNSHSLRHGRGTDLVLNEKMNIELVKKYLGHADIGSTQIYAHISDRDVENELQKPKQI
jgi:integrase